MSKILSSRLLAALLCLSPALVAAAPTVSDAEIVAGAQLAWFGERVEIHAHGGAMPSRDLLQLAEAAVEAMETRLDREVDRDTLGQRLKIFVSPDVTVSHVWRGPQHRADPRGWLFLNPKVARLGVAGNNATYAHELAHLLAWRYHSHTLREGLADYLALQIHPGAAVGPNAGGHEAARQVPDAVRALLGTTRQPPPAARSDAGFRAAYYHASYRLVEHLIGLKGMETFLQLYDAADPEPLYEALYGATRPALVDAALRSEALAAQP